MKKGSQQYLERERRRQEMGIPTEGLRVARGSGDGEPELERQPMPKPVLRREEKPATMEAAYEAVAPAIRSYRNRIRKEDVAKEARKIIEDGLGRSVSASDLDDELRDGSVTPETMIREAVQDHKKEFLARRDIPQVDTNGNGRVDQEDEPLMTPGMRRMARYI